MSVAASARVRLFFALWPDERVREALAGWSRAAQAACGGRAIPADKLHLTLFFVGGFERSRMAGLEAAAGTVRGAPFDLTLDSLGYWRHNRIVWAGASRCPPALETLAESLRVALAALGLPGEDRAYVPHLTLVRNAERKPSGIAVAPQPWPAREFALVESAPVTGGVRYDVLRRWPLTAH